MSGRVRIFVDERPLAVPEGTTVEAAVSADDPALSPALRDGRAYVTDGVGRAVNPATVVVPGAILRVVRSPRRPAAE